MPTNTTTTTQSDPVDVRGPRFAAWVTTAVLVLALVVSAASPLAAAVILTVQAVIFTIGAAGGPRKHPYGRIFAAVGRALFDAGVLWLTYLGIEPYVRRYAPDSLIGWTRLIAGRWNDPRVAADVLVGISAGLAMTLLFPLYTILPPIVGALEPMPSVSDPRALTAARYLVSALVGWPLIGLAVGFLMGEGTAWRADKRKRRVFFWLSIAWASLFALRLIVQVPLYFAGDVTALGTLKLIMGLPLFAPLVAVTWLAVRALYPPAQK